MNIAGSLIICSIININIIMYCFVCLDICLDIFFFVNVIMKNQIYLILSLSCFVTTKKSIGDTKIS